MHVLQPIKEFFLVAHEPIPKLMLPQRTLRPSPRVNRARGNFFHVMNNVGNCQRIPRPNQGVPMIRHQHIAAEQKAMSPARTFQSADQQIVFGHRERLRLAAQIDRHEEYSVGGTQPMNIGDRPKQYLTTPRSETH